MWRPLGRHTFCAAAATDSVAGVAAWFSAWLLLALLLGLLLELLLAAAAGPAAWAAAGSWQNTDYLLEIDMCYQYLNNICILTNSPGHRSCRDPVFVSYCLAVLLSYFQAVLGTPLPLRPMTGRRSNSVWRPFGDFCFILFCFVQTGKRSQWVPGASLACLGPLLY